MMDATERARLRALCEDVALPLRAECTLSGHELVDANDEYIGDIETEHSDDDEWCDEAHAALIVGAVNALPALLDDADAAAVRIAKAERERDEARAEVERLRSRLHRCACCGAEESAVAACEGDEYPLCGPCAAGALREAHARLAQMREDRDALKGALARANELRIGDRAEARLDERWACSEFAEKWLREVGEITQDTPADLADAIRARGAGGGA